MMILKYLEKFEFKYEQWSFVDFRIDIPPSSRGSDAINPHTQYSNPVAVLDQGDIISYGASFTLGDGNDLVCIAADKIVQKLSGNSLKTLKKTDQSTYDFLVNIDQLRWLSPNSGLIYQATGLIVNTIFDMYCRENKLPLWRALLNINPGDMQIFFGDLVNLGSLGQSLFEGKRKFDLVNKVSAYHTTWIGYGAEALGAEIISVYKTKGIKLFKIKIGNDIDVFVSKLMTLKALLPNDVQLCVDANQTLSMKNCKRLLPTLNDLGVVWLEEPFAPDNTLLFEEIINFKKVNNLAVEIVTGENCPSPHVAHALLKAGVDRFQADPCRMMGMLDVILVSHLCDEYGTKLTPHAGGSCLDEMSSHIVFYHYSRISDKNIDNHLVENVGFCSHLLEHEAVVSNGSLKAPVLHGFLGDFTSSVREKFINYKKGISWVKL